MTAKSRKRRPQTSNTPATATGAQPFLSFGGRLDATLVRVALLFVLCFVILDALVIGLMNTAGFYAVRVATTQATQALVRVTGIPSTSVGTRIHLPSRTLQIDPDCTGLLIVAMYAALVLAYPVRWRVKAVGLLVGVPGVLLANLARLVAVAHASELLGDAPFAFAHDYLFKVFMVAVVIGLWAWWLAYARRDARR